MQRGRPRKAEKSVKMTITLSREHYDMLVRLSNMADLHKSQVIAMAIQHFYKECQASE